MYHTEAYLAPVVNRRTEDNVYLVDLQSTRHLDPAHKRGLLLTEGDGDCNPMFLQKRAVVPD
jgi:hypothetical protein